MTLVVLATTQRVVRETLLVSTAPAFEIDVDEFWADPYPSLARMRKDAPIAFVPQLGATLLTRRDDIASMEKRIDVLSSDQPAGLMNRLMGQNMMRKDGAAHAAERNVYYSGTRAGGRRRPLEAGVPGAREPDPRSHSRLRGVMT